MSQSDPVRLAAVGTFGLVTRLSRWFLWRFFGRSGRRGGTGGGLSVSRVGFSRSVELSRSKSLTCGN